MEIPILPILELVQQLRAKKTSTADAAADHGAGTPDAVDAAQDARILALEARVAALEKAIRLMLEARLLQT